MTTSVSAAVLFNRLMARVRLRHLQLVLQVAELGSVQRAAANMGLSQSAATKLVGDVERVLDMPLFERHARGMRPTFACRDMLPLLRRVMTMLGSCAESAVAAGSGIDGTVRVGAISAGVTGVLNPVVPAFLAKNRHVRMELYEDALPTVLGQYADGEVDMVVTREPAWLAADSVFVPLLDDFCVIATRPGHILAGQKRVPPVRMRDFIWAHPPVQGQAYRAFERFFAPHGGLPEHQPLSTRSLAAILNLLLHADALLFGPYSFMRGALDAGIIVRLDCSLREPLPTLGLIHRLESRNRSVHEFQAYLMRA